MSGRSAVIAALAATLLFAAHAGAVVMRPTPAPVDLIAPAALVAMPVARAHIAPPGPLAHILTPPNVALILVGLGWLLLVRRRTGMPDTTRHP